LKLIEISFSKNYQVENTEKCTVNYMTSLVSTRFTEDFNDLWYHLVQVLNVSGAHCRSKGAPVLLNSKLELFQILRFVKISLVLLKGSPYQFNWQVIQVVLVTSFSSKKFFMRWLACFGSLSCWRQWPSGK